EEDGERPNTPVLTHQLPRLPDEIEVDCRAWRHRGWRRSWSITVGRHRVHRSFLTFSQVCGRRRPNPLQAETVSGIRFLCSACGSFLANGASCHLRADAFILPGV